MRSSEIQEFRKQLRIIERSVAGQLESQTECCGVTLAQCHALVEIGEAKTINLAGLASRIGLDTSTLSRTVESMVKDGLATRDIDPANRRAVIISLTIKGKQRLCTINQSCNKYYGQMLRSLSEEKRPLLLEGVQFVAKVLETEAKRKCKK